MLLRARCVPCLQAQATAVQMRCLLIMAGSLGTHAVSACISAAVDAPPALPGAQLAGDHLSRLGLPIAVAVARAPAAAQVQALLQLLSTARLAVRPGNALALASCLVAACAHATTRGSGRRSASQAACAALDASLALSGAAAALACLPATLLQLLAAPEWGEAVDPVASGLAAAAALDGVDRAVAAQVLAALLPLKHRVAASSWEGVAQLLLRCM
jgi:hypothetical protein